MFLFSTLKLSKLSSVHSKQKVLLCGCLIVGKLQNGKDCLEIFTFQTKHLLSKEKLMDSYPSENKPLNNRKILKIFDVVILGFLVIYFILFSFANIEMPKMR